ncbi:helix-turn-helix domain-containing protein [Clostridium cylindrosporum]|uniref:Putative transcriptional regulator n=1 Tax=Clostridium cylindrosporum DSM 605 TaxID=1121307 RepID=A0A0J8DFE8_CLOCY|nr:helix-turn-helix transcriptional regulator [Clostridium cylindrosporum]KMT22974.1 putative transcriptional regulator [Clostridium cylindrosporum DSM 605]
MLSSRLKELRREKDILQKDVAEKLNISTSAYGFYEQGKRTPDLTTLELLADFFNVSVDYLLGRTNNKNEVLIPEDYSSKHSVTKRDLNQLDDVLSNAEAFFMNDKVNDEDKEKVMRDIQELFWKAKDMNKEKYGRKKK